MIQREINPIQSQFSFKILITFSIVLFVFISIGASPLLAQFKLQKEFKKVSVKTAALFDANEDGNQDILTVIMKNRGAVYVPRLYLGNDNGGFTAKDLDIPIGMITGIRVTDMNGDDNKDVFFITEDIGQFIPQLYVGDGNGNFSKKGTNLPSYGTGTLCIGDLNGDDNEDVVISGEGDKKDEVFTSLYVGNGDGSFEKANYNFSTVYRSSCTIADVNSDGNSDILISGDKLHHQPEIDPSTVLYMGTDNGDFNIAGNELTDLVKAPSGFGDYNGDGNLDLFMIGVNSEGIRKKMLYWGFGNGKFKKEYDSKTTGHSIGLSDFNNDNKVDVIVYNHDGDKEYAELHMGNDSNHYGSRVIDIPDMDGTLFTSDVNNDERLDILITGSTKPGEYMRGLRKFKSISSRLFLNAMEI